MLTAVKGCYAYVEVWCSVEASCLQQYPGKAFLHFYSRDVEPGFSQRLFWLEAVCFQNIDAIMLLFTFLGLLYLGCYDSSQQRFVGRCFLKVSLQISWFIHTGNWHGLAYVEGKQEVWKTVMKQAHFYRNRWKILLLIYNNDHVPSGSVKC